MYLIKEFLDIMVDSIYINQELRKLEDAFYDGIDLQLLNHPDLSNFSFYLNKIITNIRKHLEQTIQTPSIKNKFDSNFDSNCNINYSQLEILSKSNIKN